MSNLARVADTTDALQPRDFDRLAAYIYKECGIRLPPVKITMIEGRLRRRVRANGLSSLRDYCGWLFDGNHLEGEREHLLNAVTTNKTDFFREPKHFDYLVDTALPKMHREGVRQLRVWSAACSTGAEPYTLAMLLDAYAQDKGGPDFGILATDLDSEVLRTARRGVYPAAMLDPVPTALRNRYVMRPSDPKRGEMRIAPALRSAIGFAQMNLMDERYPVGDAMDIIFCRNVLIYFDKPTQEKVVSRLVACLRPGGLIFLGHSESIAGFQLPLRPVANTVFERV
ncbi:chemotaxis protein methyltransferase CheR [Sphingomonas sp. SORGH_AS 950]|uniref:CheR family methyltransferase n=1 Tax=unclassified Sphingomonas TaxID=196159 RepID=UPI00278A00D1|nr:MULTISPECIES: protein-glutamate O-methyltransferase CheR [unclassified Sphingomonas]MDQ1158207.1 chemotaxis protein methyltransferase CheR [Sphingomonas sp. SORGH_AS_0950]MDR6113908.1 chemotaxis protein methyltransferase CheR [Sphingomonas sp. SORGH_AS_0789]MDR6148732.1 chemotaxis protein methyltransferase CheR [Sphingomonas sp. SORGH_AS_0742]